MKKPLQACMSLHVCGYKNLTLAITLKTDQTVASLFVYIADVFKSPAKCQEEASDTLYFREAKS